MERDMPEVDAELLARVNAFHKDQMSHLFGLIEDSLEQEAYEENEKQAKFAWDAMHDL